MCDFISFLTQHVASSEVKVSCHVHFILTSCSFRYAYKNTELDVMNNKYVHHKKKLFVITLGILKL